MKQRDRKFILGNNQWVGSGDDFVGVLNSSIFLLIFVSSLEFKKCTLIGKNQTMAEDNFKGLKVV